MAKLICSDGTVIPISVETEIKLRKAFEPKHIWEHGDVFAQEDGSYPKIYIHIENQDPYVVHLSSGLAKDGMGMPAWGKPNNYTKCPNTVFLFNIKDKL